MNMITCPKCKMRVLPKEDGTCPSCQAIISPNKITITSKTAILAKNENASSSQKQKPPAVTKSKPASIVASRSSKVELKAGNKQPRIPDASKKNQPDQQTPEHVPSKLESRYTLAMNKTVDYVFILIVLVVIGDLIVEHKINFDVILRFGFLGAALIFIFYMIFGKPKKE